MNKRALGERAERQALEMLESAGYAIVERNWVCRLDAVDSPPGSRDGVIVGELDLVAWHGGQGATLCFIEVRSRADDEHGHAAEMVTRTKQRQVSRMAGEYLHARGETLRAGAYRFDVVAITGAQIDLIQDAWRLGISV